MTNVMKFLKVIGSLVILKGNDHLLMEMTSLQPAKRKFRNPDKSRQCNHAYYHYNEDKKIRLCKWFFKNTLGINDTPTCTVLEKQIN